MPRRGLRPEWIALVTLAVLAASCASAWALAGSRVRAGMPARVVCTSPAPGVSWAALGSYPAGGAPQHRLKIGCRGMVEAEA